MKSSSAPFESTDSALFELARKGDQRAYGQLVSRHQTLVASLAYSICGDFARSQDLAQEAFVTAWQHLASLEDAAKFKSWLCGITRNLARSFIRQQTRRADQPASALETPIESASDTPGPHEQAVTREESALVWSALEQLPETYREPLILFYREHHSIERVATALDLSEDTVKQRLSRGRGMLRDQIEHLVDRSLGFTTPGVMFTTAVLSALPAVTAQIAAGSIAAIAKTGATAKAAGTLPSLLILATPLFALPVVNLVASVFMGRQLLRSCRTPQERNFLKRLWWIESVVSNFTIIAIVGLMWWQRRNGEMPFSKRMIILFLLGSIGLTVTVPIVIYFLNRARLLDYARNFLLPADASRWQRKMFFGPRRAVIYRSKFTAFGLPLIDIRFGHSAEQPLVRGTAVGWIALGDVAYGVVFALGGIAVGGIAIGGIAVGAISTGYLAGGLVAFGGVAVGGLANGIFVAIGYLAVSSGVSVAWEAAAGIVTIAKHLASGGMAFAETTSYTATHDWQDANPIVRTFKLPMILFIILPGFFNATIAVVGTNAFVRHRHERAAELPIPRSSARRSVPRSTFFGLLSVAVVAVALLFHVAIGQTSLRLSAETDAALSRSHAAVASASGDEARAKTRYELGQEFVKARKFPEALAEFLWCLDTGMPPLPGLAGTRTVSVLFDLQTLGTLYPPAQAALLERRERAEASVVEGRANGATVGDVIALNRTLHEEQRSLALYDQLPQLDPLKSALRRWLFAQFLEAKRYKEAIQAEPAKRIFQHWSSQRAADQRQERSTFLPFVVKIFHDHDVRWITDRLEALAGAGQLDEARQLLALALAYDGAKTARAVYRAGLDRAGQAELLASSPLAPRLK